MIDQDKIGKFIALCRKEKGLTQAQLGEKLNISDRAVSKWETGKCMPDSSIMLELCDILGITVNELLSIYDRCWGICIREDVRFGIHCLLILITVTLITYSYVNSHKKNTLAAD